MEEYDLAYYERRNDATERRTGLDRLDECAIETLNEFVHSTACTAEDVVHLIATIDGTKNGVWFCDNDAFSSPTSINCPVSKWVRERMTYTIFEQLPLAKSCVVKDTQQGGKDTPVFFWVLAAQSPQLLNDAPDVQRTDEEMRKLEKKAHPEYGTFLGIPEADVQWWKNNDLPNKGEEFHYASITGRTMTEQEKQYLRLLSYLPAPTSDGIQRGVEEGRKYYESCELFDSIVSGNPATTHARKVMSRPMPRIDYSNKKKV